MRETKSGVPGVESQSGSHEEEFRPMEADGLKKKGKFDKIIDSRSVSLWDSLTNARARESNLHAAEEIALPNILLESESEERSRVLEELEKTDKVERSQTS
jgi:hypothetical protein